MESWLTEENQALREMIKNLQKENTELKEQLERESKWLQKMEKEGVTVFSTK